MKTYRTAAAIGCLLEILTVINSSIARGSFTIGGELLVLPLTLLTIYIYKSSKEDNKNGK